MNAKIDNVGSRSSFSFFSFSPFLFSTSRKGKEGGFRRKERREGRMIFALRNFMERLSRVMLSDVHGENNMEMEVVEERIY